MNRRRFVGATVTGLLGGIACNEGTSGGPEARKVPPVADQDAIDPYFLDNGDISTADEKAIVDFLKTQEARTRGEPVTDLRGRPARSPTFRFLHWTGDPGDSTATLVGPLSVAPASQSYFAYGLNAQIVGFHTASEDWGAGKGRGTLTVELRGKVQNEPTTWLYVQQFERYTEGATTIGGEYLSQRDGIPAPLIVDDPHVGLRIQLMRKPQHAELLRKILRLAGLLIGSPVGREGGGAPTLQDLVPVRIPRLAREGVALSQAVFGTFATEKPIWRSGFNTYSLDSSGSARLLPGIWVVIDDDRALDLRGVMLEDHGGRVVMTRDGKPIDANYLVLVFEIGEGQPPGYAPEYLERWNKYRGTGVIPRGRRQGG
jgi:hypothetical protein